MKKVYLHIGQYKTGSSSIQNFLTDQSSFLSEHSTKFCTTGLLTNEPEVGIRHYKLWRHTLTDECLWDGVVQEINDSDAAKFVISYENFLCGFSEEQIEYVAGKLAGFDVTIICYLRRQDMLINSFYAEMVKSHKKKVEPEKFIQGFKLMGFYYGALKLWAHYFGKENIQVTSFEKLKSKKTNVVEDFLAKLSLPFPESDYQEISNPSLGSQGTANMLAFNRKVDLPRAVHRRVAKFFSTYFENDAPVRLFSQQDAKEFVESFRDDTSQLLREFDLPDDFFSKEYPPYKVFDPEAPLGDFMSELVRMTQKFS